MYDLLQSIGGAKPRDRPVLLLCLRTSFCSSFPALLVEMGEDGRLPHREVGPRPRYLSVHLHAPPAGTPPTTHPQAERGVLSKRMAGAL